MAPTESDKAAGLHQSGVTGGDGRDATTGSILAAARLASGRTLDDIADETRVPRRHLRAIELDQHDALPALPYTLGFVRSFARAVSLDAETLACRFRAETNKKPHTPTPSTLEPLDERRLPERSVVAATLIVLVVLVAGLSAWGAGVFDPSLPDTPLITATAPEMPIRLTPPSPAEAPDRLASLGGTAGEVAIVLTALEDVWVRVYDPASSSVPISRVMQAGERFEVPSDPRGLLLWTGKAGALEVRIDGALLPPLGGPVQTLRDIRLTPEGLRAQSGSFAQNNVSKVVSDQE